MADTNDITDVIQSALTEIGVTGTLNVQVEDEDGQVEVGGPDVDVVVTVTPHVH
jgi:hypothetical protein